MKITEDQAAANFVRDFFLERKGRAAAAEIAWTFNPVAQRALSRLIDDGVIEIVSGGFEWPIQIAVLSPPA